MACKDQKGFPQMGLAKDEMEKAETIDTFRESNIKNGTFCQHSDYNFLPIKGD